LPKNSTGRHSQVTKSLLTALTAQSVTRFKNIPLTERDYSSFVAISTKTGIELLPPRPPRPTKTVDIDPVVAARKATLRASTRNIQATQTHLRKTFDRYEDMRITSILRSIENPADATVIKNAWDLVK